MSGVNAWLWGYVLFVLLGTAVTILYVVLAVLHDEEQR